MNKLFASLLILLLPAVASAQYYVTIYAYQTRPNKAKYSHVFATFTTGDEQHTISWLPKHEKVDLMEAVTEGKNFSLEETLAIGKRNKAVVYQMGPYEIEKELYDKGLEQIARLESGKIKYKAVDALHRNKACNCIHAVADTVGDLNHGATWGLPASKKVRKLFSRYFIRKSF
jgi:hypothetical protein